MRQVLGIVCRVIATHIVEKLVGVPTGRSVQAQ
jgi:hypothetical protein